MTSVTWVGHSTVLIEDAGTRLLTDPVLRMRVAHLRRLPPAPAERDLGGLDAVLLSHAHYDHLDPPSLARVAHSCPVLAPVGCARGLRRRGLEVIETEPGDRVRIGALEITALQAQHDGRRHPLWGDRTTLCYLVEGPTRIFFAGDTDLFDAMGELGVGLDLALLPVWGWGPRLPPGHLDPERAARAVALLRPRLALPIHWGTLAAPRVGWLDDPEAPAREFAEQVSRLAPSTRVQVIAPGERLEL